MRRQGKPAQGPRCPRHPGPGIEHVAGPGPGQHRDGRRFLLGNNGAGDTRNLDHALQDFYAKNNLQPSPALRQAFERIINDMAANSQKLLSYQDMADAVTMQTLQSRPADYMLCGTDPQLTRDSRPVAWRHPSCVDGELGPAWEAHGPRAGGRKRGRASGHARRTSSAIFPRPTRPPCNALPLPAASRAWGTPRFVTS